MARRFGGKYSPTGEDRPEADDAPRGPFDGAEVDPVGARANLLWLPPALLALASIGDGALGLALGLSGAALLAGAAFLLRGGLRAQAAYDARRVARRPALPRKICASLLTGGGVALAALRVDPSVAAAAIYGVLAALLHLAAFGPDPLRDKGAEGVDSFQQDRVARVVDGAETYLTEMRADIARTGERQMQTRMERFQARVRELIRTVEEDPRDLTEARRYLGVYLLGARDATRKFADLYARSRDAKARADYTALLDDLEKDFAARTRKMLASDRIDLTVEIDVLRERLDREGVRSK